MDKQAFETRYREQVRDILNQLQSAIMLSSRLEASLSDVGHSIQDLTRDVELFLASDSPADEEPPLSF